MVKLTLKNRNAFISSSKLMFYRRIRLVLSASARHTGLAISNSKSAWNIILRARTDLQGKNRRLWRICLFRLYQVSTIRNQLRLSSSRIGGISCFHFSPYQLLRLLVSHISTYDLFPAPSCRNVPTFFYFDMQLSVEITFSILSFSLQDSYALRDVQFDSILWPFPQISSPWNKF